MEEIKKIGHKLAGNAGSYGFSDLGTIGAKLEAALNTDNINDLLKEYESLLKVYLQDAKSL